MEKQAEMTIKELISILEPLDERSGDLTQFYDLKEAEFIGDRYNHQDDRTVKEHWLSWLGEYHSAGYYNRKIVSGTTARDVYNRLLCPNMLIWLAERSEMPPSLILKAINVSVKGNTHLASICRKIRTVISWEMVERQILLNHFRSSKKEAENVYLKQCLSTENSNPVCQL